MSDIKLFIFCLFLFNAGCSGKADIIDALNMEILNKNYERALELADSGLVKEPENGFLKYKKAEILNHISGIDLFRAECLTLAMKYGKSLRYYKARRAGRDNIDLEVALKASILYNELYEKKYISREDGRDEGYFASALGWIYLARNDLIKAEKYFISSGRDKGLWDSERALIYLNAERNKKQ